MIRESLEVVYRESVKFVFSSIQFYVVFLYSLLAWLRFSGFIFCGCLFEHNMLYLTK